MLLTAILLKPGASWVDSGGILNYIPLDNTIAPLLVWKMVLQGTTPVWESQGFAAVYEPAGRYLVAPDNSGQPGAWPSYDFNAYQLEGGAQLDLP